MEPVAWDDIYHYVWEILATQLPVSLTYHSLEHTMQDVLPAADRLGQMAGLDRGAQLLLRTAALFHDTGFTEQYQQHELASARLAVCLLPQFGYTPEQVSEIEKIILVTQLPQSPKDFLQELMCDADLDSLGRDDFFVTCHNLLEELRSMGADIPLKQWYQRQLDFLSNHHYFTRYAEELRGAGKRANIRALEGQIASLDGK
jgi:uncharacterized protein